MRQETQRVISGNEAHVRTQESNPHGAGDVEPSQNDSNHSFRKYDLGLGKFSNEPNNLEAFISRFELVATA